MVSHGAACVTQASGHPSDIETKLSAARTRLILEKPFIGSLVMHLPLTPAPASWCETTGTDARAFYYNPGFIASLTLPQTQFVLAHEALHCALRHFARRDHRVRHRWNLACDHAVNLLLLGEGLKAPPGVLANEAYAGLTAEEIYPLIANDAEENTLDRHMFDAQGDDGAPQSSSGKGAQPEGSSSESDPSESPSGQGTGSEGQPSSQPERSAGDAAREPQTAVDREPAGLRAEEQEALARKWRQNLVSAAQQARKAGRLGESWARLVDALLQGEVPWRMLLARYLSTAARNDYSFQRRSHRESDALMPSLHSHQVDVMIAIDTSGSVSAAEMGEFLAEVDALKGQIHARITLLACDDKLDAAGPWVFESWESVGLPGTLRGGGGTSFMPVFDWVEGQNRRPDALLYFTDAEGEFPAQAPHYPVIWLVKGKAAVPWGERIQLN
ncbi:MAG: VWA-like domain-containing protein [Betaproteobacteria bacterium]|nr:VWA-like domain-containing protein [Betaproteobacteria bacterium]